MHVKGTVMLPMRHFGSATELLLVSNECNQKLQSKPTCFQNENARSSYNQQRADNPKR